MAPDIMVARHMLRTETALKLFPCDPRGQGLCGDLLTMRPLMTPNSQGRKIVCGFTCLQRIGKSAATDFWFPPDFQAAIINNLRLKTAPDLNAFRIEWAAVRQFDLLQEAGNLAVYNLEVDEFDHAYKYLMKMRAGGYRLSVVTLGHYTDQETHDEQGTLDAKLSQEISQIIHMLYLAKPSVILTDKHQTSLKKQTWTLDNAIPHVSMVFGERALFDHKNAPQAALSNQFLTILNKLSKNNIAHDVAVGLTLPDLNNRKQWIFICKGEEQTLLFQKAMTDVFQAADWISLKGLQKHVATGRDETPVMRHMRGYGDHMIGNIETWHREMAAALPTARAA